MLKALLIKELRDVAGIAGLALAAGIVIVTGLIGFQPVASLVSGPYPEVPFAGHTFEKMFGLLSFALAAALGFRQTAWEAMRGTFPFLLHRPISRNGVFLTKLAIGCVVGLLCLGLPTLVYAWWAAIQGHHASPFEGWMLEPAWRLALGMTLVYAAAFLSGLRPGRWLGTRLLPLAASAPALIFILATPWIWWLHVPIVVALYALFVAVICFVARARDYP